MPFDAENGARRIAVIGGGISGLSAALALGGRARVTVYEAEPRLGGHARTVVAGRRGDQPVDTGFIVFNHATYPHLGRLFRELEVPLERSDMSFAASIDGGRVEYALSDARGLFAQPRNMASPEFLGMLRDILRFNRGAEAAAARAHSVGELVAALGLGAGFRRLYLQPFCGAIWSTPDLDVAALPAALLVRFFRNHGLLDLTGQHQWWTVRGGSRVYVERLARRLEADGARLLRGTPARTVARDATGVTVAADGAEAERFDAVVLACHPDQALRLLARPSAAERRWLGAIRYRANRAVLHADPGQMPRRRRCWSSWNARSSSPADGVGVTYWMNRLQNLPADDPLFVTLNPAAPIDAALIYDETEFRHPVFDAEAPRAQAGIAAIQGENRTWYAGAWLRNGFHEDGIASAMRVARDMGVPAW
ncbi:MAG: cyclopropane-fatty-acyl-phospholipid synthase [Rhodovulum sulfidophilum]|uniref:Cyclopropane-fatty-acyl-phospholipid synthase n=1 Tax=Rhodovulum sulfidophilum TaxID=35806 RepID=A0A2W5N331_RHOSU|nr:MAG: cyclopropane-fatty-acyl-phospholipid synthase [Rhodovulum sulfidophilum]